MALKVILCLTYFLTFSDIYIIEQASAQAKLRQTRGEICYNSTRQYFGHDGRDVYTSDYRYTML